MKEGNHHRIFDMIWILEVLRWNVLCCHDMKLAVRNRTAIACLTKTSTSRTSWHEISRKKQNCNSMPHQNFYLQNLFHLSFYFLLTCFDEMQFNTFRGFKGKWSQDCSIPRALSHARVRSKFLSLHQLVLYLFASFQNSWYLHKLSLHFFSPKSITCRM